jgi:hypothetical protein
MIRFDTVQSLDSGLVERPPKSIVSGEAPAEPSKGGKDQAGQGEQPDADPEALRECEQMRPALLSSWFG